LRQLQGLDSGFVALETPRSPMHIGSILIYDTTTVAGGEVGFDDIVAFFAGRLQLSATVRRRLVKVPLALDHPYWVEDESFDLLNHIAQVRLEPPGDWQQLYDEAARIFSRPLDLSRPPWEFTVIQGLGQVPGFPARGYALLAKVHHAALDGLAGIDLLQALHTREPGPPPPLGPDPWRPEPVPSPIELVARSWLKTVAEPMRSLRFIGKAAPALARVVEGALNHDFTIDRRAASPHARFNAAVSPQRAIGGYRVALADVRAIRALVPGCKINDVFLATIGGALHHHLGQAGELPRRSLTALVPMSARGKRGTGATGNRIAAMIAPLGSHIADPVERLRHVVRRTHNSKAVTDAIGAEQMVEISNESPALFLALAAQIFARRGRDDRATPLYNTLITNVPGPKVPLYSAGARLHAMIGLMCLTDGMGLAHVVQSYLREATIAFTADRALMPEPEDYAACIGRSFAELLSAARAAQA
jgi:diacylglycerol O-acyltransferase